MSYFTHNLLNVATENELTEVLSHYDSEYVLSIVRNALKERYSSVPIIERPNVVAAWEQNFKALIAQYGESCRVEINTVRAETYKEIIDEICKEFNLDFTIDENIDLYSAAYYLYDFFVCNFTKYLIDFFANRIYIDRASIYDNLGLAEQKKNKDSSTIYGKKLYKDIRLAIISANIDIVINSICELEIPMYDIMSLVCSPKDLISFFMTIVCEKSGFFKESYVNLLNTDLRPVITTSIQIKMQEIASAHDQINSINMEG